MHGNLSSWFSKNQHMKLERGEIGATHIHFFHSQSVFVSEDQDGKESKLPRDLETYGRISVLDETSLNWSKNIGRALL